MQSFKTIAFEQSAHVTNYYIYLNAEKMTKSKKKPFSPIIWDQIVETPPNFHKCPPEPFKIPVQSFSFIAPLEVPLLEIFRRCRNGIVIPHPN